MSQLLTGSCGYSTVSRLGDGLIVICLSSGCLLPIPRSYL
jgi:hypothetical protein